MTPPAATVAARRAMATPGRRAVAAPRPQRRVSGRAGSVSPAPSRPVRRPARPVAVPRPARRAADRTLGERGLAWLRTLPDHRLLDRLIGGRIWIVLLGGLLVGIVTMQLTLLRLNARIGRAVEQTSQLGQRNAALRLSIAQLSDTKRIVGLATQMGYVLPPQGSPRFLTAGAGDAAKALTTMRVPDPNAAAAAAAQLAASTQAAAATTPADPAAATTADPAAAAAPTTTAPATTTTTPATAAPAATAPAGGAATSAPATPDPATTAAAGGASVPVGPQG